jgi:hypothetical protein
MFIETIITTLFKQNELQSNHKNPETTLFGNPKNGSRAYFLIVHFACRAKVLKSDLNCFM